MQEILSSSESEKDPVLDSGSSSEGEDEGTRVVNVSVRLSHVSVCPSHVSVCPCQLDRPLVRPTSIRVIRR